MATEETPLALYLLDLYQESGRNGKVNQKLLFWQRNCFS